MLLMRWQLRVHAGMLCEAGKPRFVSNYFAPMRAPLSRPCRCASARLHHSSRRMFGGGGAAPTAVSTAAGLRSGRGRMASSARVWPFSVVS